MADVIDIAAVRRRRDYLKTLYHCINCRINEYGHERGFYGKNDTSACDKFVAPAPLVCR